MKDTSPQHTLSKSSVSSFRPSFIADDIVEELEDNRNELEDVSHPEGVVWKGMHYEIQDCE